MGETASAEDEARRRAAGDVVRARVRGEETERMGVRAAGERDKAGFFLFRLVRAAGGEKSGAGFVRVMSNFSVGKRNTHKIILETDRITKFSLWGP